MEPKDNQSTLEEAGPLNEGIELSDEQLDMVAGGWLFENDKGEWEVINSKGNVKFTGTYAGALEWAESRGYSSRIIEWKELNELRNGK